MALTPTKRPYPVIGSARNYSNRKSSNQEV